MACAFFFVTPKNQALIDEIVRRQRREGIIHKEPLPPTLDCVIVDNLLYWYAGIGYFVREFVMRKEFILILLGIICVSTLSSLLSGFVPIESEKVLLDTVAGKVGAGNFTYWQLGHSGPLLVELTSLKGDADLYVADNIRPSFEVDRNNFSSVTCGADLVSIPEDFPRPVGKFYKSTTIVDPVGGLREQHSEDSYGEVRLATIAVFGIGVFGYWSHHVSEYSIQVFIDTSSVNNEQLHSIMHRAAERSELDKKKEPATPRKNDEDKPRFMKVLNIIDMIFEMFVL